MTYWRHLFYMHKSDRRVLLALLTVAAVALAALWVVGDGEPAAQNGASADSLTATATPPAERKIYYKTEERTVERFPFDPNTADSTQLLRLGLAPYQVRNIYKYRAAGGVYTKKEDFARLYGLTVKQYRELEPYIVISPDYLPAATLFAHHEATPDTLPHPHKLAQGEHIGLNAADTAQYQMVPGIGSYFARRIIEYGERLGGYVSVEQLREIDDFPAEALAYFEADTVAPRRLNINLLTLNQLKRHPYINYYQARAIVDYRRQHGAIHDLAELRLLRDFTEEAIQRLRPYVCYE